MESRSGRPIKSRRLDYDAFCCVCGGDLSVGTAAYWAPPKIIWCMKCEAQNKAPHELLDQPFEDRFSFDEWADRKIAADERRRQQQRVGCERTTDAAVPSDQSDTLAHVGPSPSAATTHTHPTSDPRYAEEF